MGFYHGQSAKQNASIKLKEKKQQITYLLYQTSFKIE